MNALRTLLAFCALLLLSTPVVAKTPARSANEKATQQFYETIRSNPLTLRGFIAEMPKGGDLRVRLSESIYPEDYLLLAEKENYCITLPTFFLVPPLNNACPPGTSPAHKFFDNEANYQKALKELDALSHKERTALISFADITTDQFGFLLGTVVNNAAFQKLDYMEVLVPWFPKEGEKELKKIKWEGSPDEMVTKIATLPFMKHVVDTATTLQAVNAKARVHSGSAKRDVTVRYIIEVDRTEDPLHVFAKLIYAYKTVLANDDVVGVALSGDEAHPVALRDYKLQMQMLEALAMRQEYRPIKPIITAGYLTLGMVQPVQFTDRIRSALTLGRASRISHGSSVMYENDPYGLLESLERTRTPVEIALTSEEHSRAITPAMNPFPVLKKFHIPVVLVTESGAINRFDITNEYTRAAQEYGLSYADVKALVRNTLEFSQLSGKSLWKTTAPYTVDKECRDSLEGKETGTCKKLLQESPKARAQWKLENAFTAFERKYSAK